MFANILLPIELSHPGSWEKALPMAVRMAGSNGTLHVLGIVHDLGASMIASYLPPGFEESALRRMQTDLEAFIDKEVPKGVTAKALVHHGHVPEHVLVAADEVNADMIVMASHPPNELRTFLVGSNADKVVHHAQRPVLVVR